MNRYKLHQSTPERGTFSKNLHIMRGLQLLLLKNHNKNQTTYTYRTIFRKETTFQKGNPIAQQISDKV